MSTSVKALSVFFLIMGGFFLGFAIASGLLIEFTTLPSCTGMYRS